MNWLSNSLPEGVVRIHLDTRTRLSARLAAQIIDSMAASIESNRSLEPDVSVVLEMCGEGTWWAQVMVLVGGAVAFAGTTVLAAQALIKEVQEGRTPFARAVPAALDQGDGRAMTVYFEDNEITVTVEQMIAYPVPVGEDPIEWIKKGAKRKRAKLQADIPILTDRPNQTSAEMINDTGNDKAIADIATEANRRMEKGQKQVSYSRALTIAYSDDIDPALNAAEVIIPAEFRNHDGTIIEGIVEKSGDDIRVVDGKKNWFLQGLQIDLGLKIGDTVRVAGKHYRENLRIYPIDVTLVR